MPLATPLQGFRVKSEKQASFVRLRLRDEPFVTSVIDEHVRGPPERSPDRTHEQGSREPDLNVIDFTQRKKMKVSDEEEI